MPEEVTDAMTKAAMDVLGLAWKVDPHWTSVDFERIRRAIAAALDAAPGGHGERG